MKKIFHSINIFAYYHTTWENVASTINRNAEPERKIASVYGINTRPAKSRQVLYSYENLYSRYIDRNFSVNS